METESPTTGRPRWWYVVHSSESTLMELEAKWDQVKVQTSWKLEPCFLAENQIIPPPSVTATDATSILLPTHIDVQPSLSPSQPPAVMECTQSEEFGIQVSSGTASYDPNSVIANFLLEETEDQSQTLQTQ